MDPIQNPYAPGAGTRPPEFAGRGEIRETARIALERIRRGRPSKSIILVGLRGVGKTVLLNRMREDAAAHNIHTAEIEAPEHRPLPAALAPYLRQIALQLSRREVSRQLAHRALRGLAGFVSTLKVRYQDIEFGIDFPPEPGLADYGDLETDLQDLFGVIGAAAQAADTCVALFIDELQYAKEEELAALTIALHRSAQRQLPVTLIGAGLPQVRGRTGKAKSYAERLFDFPEIAALSPADARRAIAKPAQEEGVEIEDDALDAIVSQTKGYPYFLQEWGKHVWDAAESSPITASVVNIAAKQAIVSLDRSFFRVRFDRLTPAERRYLRAMAELGPGPHRSGIIAQRLGRAVSSLAPTRNNLIGKGMVWSPGHGDTDFTVPMFDEFLLRAMPADSADS